MKRGPIPKKKQVIMLRPEERIETVYNLKIVEDKLLKIKKVLSQQEDELLIILNIVDSMRVNFRQLGTEGRTWDE